MYETILERLRVLYPSAPDTLRRACAFVAATGEDPVPLHWAPDQNYAYDGGADHD